MNETEFINALGALLEKCPESLFLVPMEPMTQEEENEPMVITVVRRDSPGCGKALAHIPYPHN